MSDVLMNSDPREPRTGQPSEARRGVRIRLRCFGLERAAFARLFDAKGQARISADEQHSAQIEEFAALVDDEVSIELLLGGRSVYLAPRACHGTAALLAYQRSLVRTRLARAWLELVVVARLRRRSRATLQRQLSSFRAELRPHAPGLDPFEVRRGTLRCALEAFEFCRR